MRLTPRLALAALAALLLTTGCASDPSDVGTTPAPDQPRAGGVGPETPRTGGSLPADALPFTEFAANFATRDGETREVRTQPVEGGIRMTISSRGSLLGYLDWRRDGAAVLLSDGPDRWVEMLRIGAQPGTSWVSSGRTIRFDGWERVKTPAGDFDSIRITTSTSVKGIEESETWWFAPGDGLVRLTQNKGDLFRTEMWRTR